MVEEKDMITTKLSIVFKRIKFVDSDSELSNTGNIALFLYKELRVPENYREVWWEQMKKHVCKKLDERRSNCGTALKKTIISKWNILWKNYFHKQSLTLFYFQNSASRRGTSTPPWISYC